MQFKSYPTEFKVDEEKNIIEGYASVFGNKDSHEDIVERGCFTKTLAENRKRIKMLWQHKVDEPIGKPLVIEQDSKGLYTKTKITPTDVGKKTLMLARDGVIEEMSIGYDTIKEEWDDSRNANILKELRLWEYSAVTWGSNELSLMSGVKNMNQLFKNLEGIIKGKRLIKEGRTLSQENYSLIQDAIMALEELLNNAESSNDTHYEDDDKSGDHLSDLKSIALAGLKDETNEHELLSELRKFSKQLREGE